MAPSKVNFNLYSVIFIINWDYVWNIYSLTQSFRPHHGPKVDSASNRNEYQEYFLGVKAAGA